MIKNYFKQSNHRELPVVHGKLLDHIKFALIVNNIILLLILFVK